MYISYWAQQVDRERDESKLTVQVYDKVRVDTNSLWCDFVKRTFTVIMNIGNVTWLIMLRVSLLGLSKL